MEKMIVYERQAEVAKAIAHPLRMAVLDYLRNGPQCVCDIAAFVRSERSNISKHLSVMVAAGVLDYNKEGLKVIYKLRAPCILKFVDCITECLKENALHEQKILNAI
jgi:ArsR family transcriptional regulator